MRHQPDSARKTPTKPIWDFRSWPCIQTSEEIFWPSGHSLLKNVSAFGPHKIPVPRQRVTQHQFDGAVEDAGEILARDMLSVVPSLLGQGTPTTNDSSSSRLHTTSSSPSSPSRFFKRPPFRLFLSGHCLRTEMII